MNKLSTAQVTLHGECLLVTSVRENEPGENYLTTTLDFLCPLQIGLRHRVDDDVMIYPGYIPRKGVEPLILHYGIPFNVSSWYFSKSEHIQDAIVDDCNRLFQAPPYPQEVNSIAGLKTIQAIFLLT
jgi:hypothetical protein